MAAIPGRRPRVENENKRKRKGNHRNGEIAEISLQIQNGCNQAKHRASRENVGDGGGLAQKRVQTQQQRANPECRRYHKRNKRKQQPHSGRQLVPNVLDKQAGRNNQKNRAREIDGVEENGLFAFERRPQMRRQFLRRRAVNQPVGLVARNSF